MTSCHQCHPGGKAGLGPAINNKPLPGFMIKLQSRAGVGAMPGFSSSELSDEELNAIVAYLKIFAQAWMNYRCVLAAQTNIQFWC